MYIAGHEMIVSVFWEVAESTGPVLKGFMVSGLKILGDAPDTESVIHTVGNEVSTVGREEQVDREFGVATEEGGLLVFFDVPQGDSVIDEKGSQLAIRANGDPPGGMPFFGLFSDIPGGCGFKAFGIIDAQGAAAFVDNESGSVGGVGGGFGGFVRAEGGDLVAVRGADVDDGSAARVSDDHDGLRPIRAYDPDGSGPI